MADVLVRVTPGRVSACGLDFSSHSRTLPGRLFACPPSAASAKIGLAEANPILQEFMLMAHRYTVETQR